ncbi:hypothetical protein OSB04_001425 [Centaurea solstitialis]|uniref:Ubiquitin-like protease family profile domain-containing protein n=1 Tax=Centaurea solstitialis TaxID=347529 RepID=A0AA38WUF3_9ASTR|nr:hypothetical protein OSB04_001425 [Centaurea solstitialis]
MAEGRPERQGGKRNEGVPSFSHFTNTPDNPIVLDFEEEEDNSTNTEHSPKHSVTNNSSGEGTTNEKCTTGPLPNVVKMEGVETMLKDLSMNEKLGKTHELEVIDLDGAFRRAPLKKAKIESPSADPKEEVIDISTTPEYTRNRKREEAHAHQMPNDQDAQISYDKRAEIKAGKQIKDEDVDVINKKARTDQQPSINADVKNEMDVGPSQLHSQKNEVEKFATLNTRTSPRTLYETVIGLNQAQRRAVCDMGLESIINMTIDGVPYKLGFYVVDILNTKKMSLDMINSSIQITTQSIHDLMGLRLGGLDLEDPNDEDGDESIVDEWKSQFDKPKIRPTDVMKLILETDDASFRFKMNFLVLFVNLMAECTPSGICNVNFISKIKNEEMIPRIDWCKFIYNKIKQSKQRWKGENRYCFYAGPLTYITLLYVEATMSPRVVIPQKKHAITSWNIGLLRKREATEIAAGGFGMLPVKPEYTESNLKEGKRSADAPKSPLNEPGEKVYITVVEKNIKLILMAKDEAEKTIDEALNKFPRDPNLLKYKHQLKSMFNMDSREERSGPSSSPKTPKASTSQDTDRHPSTLTPLYVSPEFLNELDRKTEKVIKDSKAKKRLHLSNDPDFHVHETNYQSTVKIMSVTPSKSMTRTEGAAALDDDIPTFDLGISPVKITPPNEVPKLHHPSSTSSMEKGKHVMVNVQDKRVKEWALANFGSVCDYVFKTDNCIPVARRHIESLPAKATLNPRILDAWVCVLNADEQLRSRDSPEDTFSSQRLRTRTKNINNQYQVFRTNLVASTNNNMDKIRLKDIDLAFFPIVSLKHWYVVVFNLKNPAVVILDNRRSTPKDYESMLKLYNYVTDVLQILMTMHLKNVQHPAGNILDGIRQERLEMEWQTRSNYTDYGIFTMRHMECYMGINRGWRIGITKEGAMQNSQLDDLRVKITTKLLLSKCNNKKEYVEGEIEKWFSIDEEIRAQLSASAYESQTDRLQI